MSIDASNTIKFAEDKFFLFSEFFTSPHVLNNSDWVTKIGR